MEGSVEGRTCSRPIRSSVESDPARLVPRNLRFDIRVRVQPITLQ